MMYSGMLPPRRMCSKCGHALVDHPDDEGRVCVVRDDDVLIECRASCVFCGCRERRDNWGVA